MTLFWALLYVCVVVLTRQPAELDMARLMALGLTLVRLAKLCAHRLRWARAELWLSRIYYVGAAVAALRVAWSMRARAWEVGFKILFLLAYGGTFLFVVLSCCLLVRLILYQLGRIGLVIVRGWLIATILGLVLGVYA
jgi:hypothetical protein